VGGNVARHHGGALDPIGLDVREDLRLLLRRELDGPVVLEDRLFDLLGREMRAAAAPAAAAARPVDAGEVSVGAAALAGMP
jgi:hypothetical protein